ncbi:uncharacterized protein LOC116192934 [Punica granatum]|uniref:Uncharacterized protein LOC116192934 n=1 Tax=Punica granatum TaxID=22663 RepID=A0A6P8C460_PUNGR|nr:uncharacterized protein LOC116192934 [Punica granatum]
MGDVLLTLVLHHGCKFVWKPFVEYIGGHINVWENVDIDKLSITMLKEYFEEYGYTEDDYKRSLEFYYEHNLEQKRVAARNDEARVVGRVAPTETPNNRKGLVDEHESHCEAEDEDVEGEDADDENVVDDQDAKGEDADDEDALAGINDEASSSQRGQTKWKACNLPINGLVHENEKAEFHARQEVQDNELNFVDCEYHFEELNNGKVSDSEDDEASHLSLIKMHVLVKCIYD